MVKDYKHISVAIVTHVYATGPAFFLEEYLVSNRVGKLLFIGLPFSYAKDQRPFIRFYENGKLIEDKKLNYQKLPEVLIHIKDIIIVMYFVIRKQKFDMYIGVDNLNALTGILLRFLKFVNCVVFYTIDYVPKRFSNKLLNGIYHTVERIAVYESNVIWNLSQKMLDEREKNGYKKEVRKKQILVPIGTQPIKKPRTYKSNEKQSIVFMGHLREKQGVDFLLRSFKRILAINKYMKLVIIGGGKLESPLKKYARDLEIEKHVEFTGFVKDYKKVQELLLKSTIAAAPYVDDSETYTRFTDPGKVKDYLSLGLPVIVTKVPEVAFEIEKRKAGKAISYDEDQFVKAAMSVLKDTTTIKNYRKNAYTMALDYTWKKLFDRAFKETFKLC